MLDGDRSFEELPVGTVMLRSDDGELFEKTSTTEVTSFGFDGKGQRYDNDVPLPWKGALEGWDWVVLSEDEVEDARNDAMTFASQPGNPMAWLVILALTVGAAMYFLGK